MISRSALFCTLYCLVAGSYIIEMDDPQPVSGDMGKDVIIPCSFRVQQSINEATVLWWKNTAYTGPLLYKCTKNGKSTNCSKSAGRFSLAGNLTEKNISLRISKVLFSDFGLYFCRIELIDKFTSKGISLQVAVAEELQRIYFQTTEKGERLVTCEVSGNPPPNVNWTQPATVNSSQILVHHGYFISAFSIPAFPNTNYTCQIVGDRKPGALSIYSLETSECNDHVYLIVIGVLASTLGIVLLYITCVLVNMCKIDRNKTPENDDIIYHNYPRLPDIDAVYKNA